MVQQGKCKMTLPVGDPAIVALNGGGGTIYLYVERGDKITVTGESADIYSWKIGGNEINEEWSRWCNENKADLSSGDPKKINSAVERYVKKNPSNPVSTLLLLYEYDRKENNSGFLSQWNLLKGDAAKEKWITLSGRSDLYTNRPLPAVDLKKRHTLILKSLDNGVDTIVSGKVPVALLFWRNTDRERDKMIDSLRTLRKNHPDSSSYIIADICFDYDSISWVAPIGRDSLRHVIHGWNPMAETDSAVRALGVETTPTLIILPALAPKKKEITKKENAKK
ncbi:MAG: hypothetical protein K2L89_06915 [Muribaculaceae bacterium]|nr:hypothetical protein [Muribaculaceae bacterium]